MPIRVQQKFNDAQFVQTSVQPNPRVPHEINTTGKRMSATAAIAFPRGSYQGHQPSLLAILQQRAKRISKLPVTSGYRAATARPLTN
jgi:hypothetical protein